MDFNAIAQTQEFEGNTIDVIFPKRFQENRKRKLTNAAELDIVLKPSVIESQESLEFNRTATQLTDSQEPFTFTNENIFRNPQTTSALFEKYFPPQVLTFTAEELAEINELYASLQEKQVAGRLTQSNLNDSDRNSSSGLIERFLRDAEANREKSCSLESPPFFMDGDSNSPVDQQQQLSK